MTMMTVVSLSSLLDVSSRSSNDDGLSSTSILWSIIFIIVSMLLIWLKVTKDRMRKQKQKQKIPPPPFQDGMSMIPMVPNPHWFFGHVHKIVMASDQLQGHDEIYLKYANKYGMSWYWFFNTPTLTILSGKDAKTILTSSSTHPSFSYVSNHLKQLLGQKTILVLEGKEWKRQRTAIHKSLVGTINIVEQFQSSMNHIGTILSESLRQAISNNNDEVEACTNNDHHQHHQHQQQQQQEQGDGLKMNVLSVMKMATMDVFGSTILGVNFEGTAKLQLPQVGISFEYLLGDFLRRMQTPLNSMTHLYNLPITKANRDYAHHRNIVRSFVKEQIILAKQRLQDGDDMKHDLVTNIIKAAAAAGVESDDTTAAATATAAATEDLVCDMAVSLLFAGYDTTSITLSYAIYLVAKHPSIEVECMKEIHSVLGNDPQPNSNKLKNPMSDLPYTKAVILESLRLYPPAVVAFRILEKDIKLQHEQHVIIIPKGTRIVLPLWLIQRHEMNFPSPTDMRPDRWVRKRTVSSSSSSSPSSSSSSSCWEDRPENDWNSSDIAPANRDAFLAFSAGARNCVGKNLALREAITLLAYTLRKVKFELINSDSSYEVKPKVKLLQEPHDGLPMILKHR